MLMLEPALAKDLMGENGSLISGGGMATVKFRLSALLFSIDVVCSILKIQ
jgi:hypothetical protein